MDDNMKDIVLETMEDAEMVLVGIGGEFGEGTDKPEESAEYAVFMEKTGGNGQLQWMLPFLEGIHAQNAGGGRVAEAYRVLEGLLRDKNYFIVSTRTDDCIYDTGLRQDRIVTPCGGYRLWQCVDGCGNKVYDREEALLEKIRAWLDGNGTMEGMKAPLCPLCGKQMIPNNIKAGNYVEAGYLDAWNQYRKWLQGTVNRKLCVLELGVGMKYPGVIRWPFEKMVFFNQKSTLFRVHSKLYQLTEEIKDRGYKIGEKPIDFLINRFV